MNSRISSSDPARPSASRATADMICPGVQYAALKTVVTDERLLQRVQRSVPGEPLDRRYLPPLALRRQRQARQHTPAVEQHRARPARALITALLRARQAQPVA